MAHKAEAQSQQRVRVFDTETGETFASLDVADAFALSEAQLQELADFAQRLRSSVFPPTSERAPAPGGAAT